MRAAPLFLLGVIFRDIFTDVMEPKVTFVTSSPSLLYILAIIGLAPTAKSQSEGHFLPFSKLFPLFFWMIDRHVMIYFLWGVGK